MAREKNESKPVSGVTRRDFLRGGAAGAVTTGLLSGSVEAAGQLERARAETALQRWRASRRPLNCQRASGGKKLR